jgi:hypothetical protein
MPFEIIEIAPEKLGEKIKYKIRNQITGKFYAKKPQSLKTATLQLGHLLKNEPKKH